MGFEGHRTVSQFQKALAFKVCILNSLMHLSCCNLPMNALALLYAPIQVFLSLFFNTSCIVLLINAALPSTVSNVSIAGQRILVGQYAGFDVSWHVSVGAGIG